MNRSEESKVVTANQSKELFMSLREEATENHDVGWPGSDRVK
jgi:hypothetical protein